MSLQAEPVHKTVGLMSARFIAGGAFLFAGYIKISAPKVFMGSVKAFELLPEALIPFVAYLVPWTEIIVGLLLIMSIVIITSVRILRSRCRTP